MSSGFQHDAFQGDAFQQGALVVAAGGRTGTLSVTLDDVALSSTSTVALKAVLTATLSDLTLSSAGTLSLSGTSSVTLGDVALSASGALAIAGALTATLGDVTGTLTGVVDIDAQTTATLEGLSLSATGTLAISAELTATLDDIGISAEATISGGTLEGVLTATLEDLSLVATAVLSVVPSTRRGGRSDETGSRKRQFKWTKRKTYTEWSERYWEERKKREEALLANLLGTGPEEDGVELEIPPIEPPPLIEAEAPAVEQDRLAEIMRVAQAAFATRAGKLQKLALKRVAEQARIELPSEGQNEQAEQRAMLEWLEARRLWIEQRQAEEAIAEAARLEAIEQEHRDEEEVILLLLAA
jgi:hypothetical protein